MMMREQTLAHWILVSGLRWASPWENKTSPKTIHSPALPLLLLSFTHLLSPSCHSVTTHHCFYTMKDWPSPWIPRLPFWSFSSSWLFIALCKFLLWLSFSFNISCVPHGKPQSYQPLLFFPAPITEIYLLDEDLLAPGPDPLTWVAEHLLGSLVWTLHWWCWPPWPSASPTWPSPRSLHLRNKFDLVKDPHTLQCFYLFIYKIGRSNSLSKCTSLWRWNDTLFAKFLWKITVT